MASEATTTVENNEEFPINAKVVLHGLVKAEHLNDKKGIVKSSSVNGRQHVYVEELSKSVALKGCNLKYEVREIDSLSVKELKTVLMKKNAASMTETSLIGLDKRDLRSMASQLTYESTEEIARILATGDAPQPSSSPNGTTTSSRTTEVSSTTPSNVPSARPEDVVNNMDPEKLREQARRMRSMPPATLRRMNPQLANMTDAQIVMSIQQMEMMAENPSMMDAAREQMKNMSPGEMERLRSQMHNPAGVFSGADAAAQKPPSMAQGADMMANMSPETMRQQARAMKSMDPNTIRSMNPTLAHMTDAQIKIAADQMEMMAENPSMMKAAAEQMKNMNPDDIQKIQEDLTNGDPKQIKQMLNMMKDNPEMVRQQAAATGMSPEQLSKGIDMFSKMDEKQIDTAMKYLSKAQKMKTYWDKANATAGGHLLKILVLLFVSVVFLLVQKFWFSAADVSLSDAQQDTATKITETQYAQSIDSSETYGGEQDEFSEF